MRGVSIGVSFIIASGSVSTKSVPSGEIWGGVPPRKIKNRFQEAEQLDIQMHKLVKND